MIIHSGARFTLHSWGNGLSYNLVNRQVDLEYFCQGDDASDFEREQEDAEKAFPDKSADEILLYLWMHVYVDAATKIEG